MITGGFPIGHRFGHAFVHDPACLNRSSVKATINLRFRGQDGVERIVGRKMEVTQTKKTPTFKQLDGSMYVLDASSFLVSSRGYRGSDLDRNIPLLMGVSKAILENVIFCHQEDASWPLQEGAVLKKRFDDIFDTTSYTDTAEVYGKLKKEYAAKAKDLEHDLKVMSLHQDAVNEIHRKLTQFRSQMEAVETEKQGLEKEKKVIENEFSRLEEIRKAVRLHQATSPVELTRQLAEIKDLHPLITKDLTKTHTAEQVKELMNQLDRKQSQEREEENKLVRELRENVNEMNRIRTEEAAVEDDRKRLPTLKEDHLKHLKTRFQKMAELRNAYHLDDALTSITQCYHHAHDPVWDIPKSDMDQFGRALERKEAELVASLNEYKKARHKSALDQVIQVSQAHLNAIPSHLGDKAYHRQQSVHVIRQLIVQELRLNPYWSVPAFVQCPYFEKYTRLVDEAERVGSQLEDAEEPFLESCRQLAADKSSSDEHSNEGDKLRLLLMAADGCSKDARKVTTTHDQVTEKRIDLTLRFGVNMRGRNFQTLDGEMEEYQQERDQLNTKVRPKKKGCLQNTTPKVFLTHLFACRLVE
jgi:DNA repair exonuclease SbcCD ATPase subunit